MIEGPAQREGVSLVLHWTSLIDFDGSEARQAGADHPSNGPLTFCKQYTCSRHRSRPEDRSRGVPGACTAVRRPLPAPS